MRHNGATMSRSTSNSRQRVARGGGRPPRLQTAGRSVHSSTLLLLVMVVFIVALLMVLSLIGFVVKPNPAVKAGPMYVTLALTTLASLLMALMALNASYLPIIPAKQAPNIHLVMWAMGVTGVVTGLLTLGKSASSIAMRFTVAGIAFMFITTQNARRTRARAAASAGRASAPAPAAHSRSRQRRGGRKH